jgi:hypothetical protein
MSLVQPWIRATLLRGICATLFALIVFLSACVVASEAFAATATKLDSSTDHVHVSARRAGDSILIVLRVDPGYHVNANPASNEYLIPTRIAFEGIAPERISYPPPVPFKPAFSDEPINVYEGAIVITATFSSVALDQMRNVGFTLTVQACTEQICLPPDDITGRATW